MNHALPYAAWNQGYQDEVDGCPLWFGRKPERYNENEWLAYKAGCETARAEADHEVQS